MFDGAGNMLTGIVSSLRLKDDRQDCERRGRRHTNHGGPYVPVAERLLDGSDVAAVLKQVRQTVGRFGSNDGTSVPSSRFRTRRLSDPKALSAWFCVEAPT